MTTKPDKISKEFEVIVRCDEPSCGYKFKDFPRKHHNKPCPRCGKGILINDDELAVIDSREIPFCHKGQHSRFKE